MEMANKHKKECSTSLDIREMHIETTLKYDYTLTRIAEILKDWQ